MTISSCEWHNILEKLPLGKIREMCMNSVEKFYMAVGADANEVVTRLGGSAAMVGRFLEKFKEDESFAKLGAALDDGDVENAFREAHTLKGLCANLGIQRLFERAADVTEILRAENLSEARRAFPALRTEYEITLEALAHLEDGE